MACFLTSSVLFVSSIYISHVPKSPNKCFLPPSLPPSCDAAARRNKVTLSWVKKILSQNRNFNFSWWRAKPQAGGASTNSVTSKFHFSLRAHSLFKKNMFTDNKVINRTFSGMLFFPTSAQLSSKSEEIKIALIIIFALSKSVVPAVLLYIFPACDSVRRQVHNTKRSTQLNRTLWHTGAIRFAFSCYD